MNFRECANEGDSMERVTDQYHRKAVGKSRHQVWGGITFELNALVEIVDGFPEPQADNQERGDTCRSLHQRQVVEKRYFDGIPIMKPKIPIQAQARWTMGSPSVAPNLAPSLNGRRSG